MAKKIDLRVELECLEREVLNYNFIKEFSCNSEEEFKTFKENNSTAFGRLKFIKNRIREIEEQLMSDDDKRVHFKYLEDLKKKFDDKNPF